MSNICEFCGHEFTRKENMVKHKQTAKFCLKIQNEMGNDVKRKEFLCKICGGVYSSKYSLERHHKNAHNGASIMDDKPVTQTFNAGHGINIDNSNNINIILNFGDKLSDITPEKIREMIHKSISMIPPSVTESGVESLTERVAHLLLKNDNMNWMVRTADASRNKLSIMTETSEEDDIGGHKTAEFLRDPMSKIGRGHYCMSERKDDVMKTLEIMHDKTAFRKESLSALLRVLPKSFDEKSQNDLSKLREESMSSEDIKLGKLIVKHRKIKKRESRRKYDKLIDELGESIPLHDGTYWHKESSFVVTFDGRLPTIIGKRSTMENKTADLTKADIKIIIDRGGKKLLHPKYLGADIDVVQDEKKADHAEERAKKDAIIVARNIPKDVAERGDKICALIRNSSAYRMRNGVRWLSEHSERYCIQFISGPIIYASDPSNDMPNFEIIGYSHGTNVEDIRELYDEKLALLDRDPLLSSFIAKKYANAPRPRKLTLQELYSEF